MLSRDKILAALLCACLIIAAVFSLSVGWFHNDDHCLGEDCAVCACVEHIRAFSRLLELAALGLLAGSLFFGVRSRIVSAAALFPPATPVSLCVRMNH